jgi:hypothetical protein
MAKKSGRAGPVLLLLTLAALTSGGLFLWSRQTFAMPACAAFAQAQGMTLVTYRPVSFVAHNRLHDPNGKCILLNHDGVMQSHNLSRELHGWRSLAVISLHYDLIFFLALVGWGLIIAMRPGGKTRTA